MEKTTNDKNENLGEEDKKNNSPSLTEGTDLPIHEFINELEELPDPKLTEALHGKYSEPTHLTRMDNGEKTNEKRSVFYN